VSVEGDEKRIIHDIDVFQKLGVIV